MRLDNFCSNVFVQMTFVQMAFVQMTFVQMTFVQIILLKWIPDLDGVGLKDSDDFLNRFVGEIQLRVKNLEHHDA